MKLYLAYPDLRLSARILDDKRLEKQVMFCASLLRAIHDYNVHQNAMKMSSELVKLSIRNKFLTKGIVDMWHEYPDVIRLFQFYCIQEQLKRKFGLEIDLTGDSRKLYHVNIPSWFNDYEVFAGNRSFLLQKDYPYYKQYNWKEPSGLPMKFYTSTGINFKYAGNNDV